MMECLFLGQPLLCQYELGFSKLGTPPYEQPR
jgi:hypothetical protein